ncbi:MAG: SBBP repeat-containing protein, partial [Desulfurococcales archaeon]|nr:SBBP repeat-containing protein [Desulfurococcales archaeon]
ILGAHMRAATLLVVVALSILLTNGLLSHATSNYWFESIGGNNIDYGYSLTVDSTYIYVVGDSLSYTADSEIFTIQLDNTGTLQWAEVIGSGTSTGTDKGSDIEHDASGNIYIIGSTQTAGAGGFDIAVMKLDNQGNPIWVKTIGGANDDYGTSLTIDGNGNIYFVGYTSSFGAGAYDVITGKIDPNGNLVWATVIGGSSYDYGQGIVIDNNGYLYITGHTQSYTSGADDVFIAKISSTGGGLVWFKTFGGSITDKGLDIATDGTTLYLTGITYSYGSNGEIFVVEMDSNGNIAWSKIIGGGGVDTGYSVTVDTLGNVFLTGSTSSVGNGGYDICIAKLDSTGTLQWFKTIGGTYTDEGEDIVVDSAGYIYIVGYSSSYSNDGSQDVVVARMDSTGSIPGTSNLVYDHTVDITVSPISLTVIDRTPQTSDVTTSVNVNSWNPTVTVVTPSVVPIPEPALIIVALIISVMVLILLKTRATSI